MSSDLSSLENDLRRLNAAPLDESLLERLEACAAGTWTQLDPLEKQFEQRLRGFTPAALDSRLLERLESTVATVPFPAEAPRIVHFPTRQTPARQSRGGWWAAAAAVALLGSLAGWLLPQHPATTPVAEVQNNQAQPAPAAPTTPLVPAGYNRGLSEASDEGVVMHNDHRPHRVLKFVYREQVTLKDANGRTYHVEQPQVEYLFVPAKTD